MESGDPDLILERKRREIAIGIRDLIKSVTVQDNPEPEEIINVMSEASNAHGLDYLLANQSYLNIWTKLENIDLKGPFAYFYLGLIIDYDDMPTKKFFKVIKNCLQKLNVNYQDLINFLKHCGLEVLIKLITIFVLAEKVDKDKLDGKKIYEINNSFIARFNSIYLRGDSLGYLDDFLVRRFLQFLNFADELNLGKNCTIPVDSWSNLLECASSAQTFKYIFPALKNHIKFAKDKTSETPHLVSCLLSRSNKARYWASDQLFLKNKNWMSSYIKFYLDDLLSETITYDHDTVPYDLFSSDPISYDMKIQRISSAISLFISFITDKNKKKLNK
ncbi:unnamed protein product [Blepharisma stoltei]|uniref:Uncharacterized protein n=1 Tax=Blepharisma stoltei TaxID=1481888 RepID=A0AAU9K4L7_9CILI|nr:unnamed protein product [Blepharisma stoltei]